MTAVCLWRLRRWGRVPLRRLFQTLRQRYGVRSILLEGGGELIGSALEARLVDRVVWFVAPMIIGGRLTPSAVGGTGIQRLPQAIRLDALRVRRVGKDLMIEATVAYPTRNRKR